VSGGESRPQQLHFVVKVGVGAISVGVAASRQVCLCVFRREAPVPAATIHGRVSCGAPASVPCRLEQARHVLKGCLPTADTP